MTQQTPSLDIVTCENCGQQNRLPAVVPVGHHAACGNCHEDLAPDDDDDDEDEDA